MLWLPARVPGSCDLADYVTRQQRLLNHSMKFNSNTQGQDPTERCTLQPVVIVKQHAAFRPASGLGGLKGAIIRRLGRSRSHTLVGATMQHVGA